MMMMTNDNGWGQNMTITLPCKLFHYTQSFSQATLILLSWICLFEIRVHYYYLLAIQQDCGTRNKWWQ